MIYGNKFYGYGIGDPTDFLGIISADVQTIESLYNNYNEAITESKLTDTIFDKIDTVFTKLKEIFIKILNTVSKIFKKVLPFVYKGIQKLITYIKNDMNKPSDRIVYNGKKEFKVITLNNKINSILADVERAHFDNDVKEIADLYTNNIMLFDTNDDEKIKNGVKEINEKVSKFNENMKKKLEPFRDILSLETFKEFYETTEYIIESANDYYKFKDIMEVIIDDNVVISGKLQEIHSSIGSIINRLNFSHITGNSAISMRTNQTLSIAYPDASTLSSIPKVYTKILDVYTGAIKSEIKIINEISKYCKYSISISNYDGEEFITKHN